MVFIETFNHHPNLIPHSLTTTFGVKKWHLYNIVSTITH